MLKYFSLDYSGGDFKLFGTAHLCMIAIVILAIYLIIISLRKADEQAKKRFRYILAFVLIGSELIWELIYVVSGRWSISTNLPFHLCVIMTYLGAFTLITKNKHCYEFLYLIGMNGALQAILTPSIINTGFPHFLFFQTFIIHGAIILAALYLTIIEKLRPRLFSFVKVVVGINIYMLLVGLINWLVGGNYMFIAHKPEFPSLIDSLGPWPVYIFILEAIGLALAFIVYIPFLIIDIKAYFGKKK